MNNLVEDNQGDFSLPGVPDPPSTAFLGEAHNDRHFIPVALASQLPGSPESKNILREKILRELRLVREQDYEERKRRDQEQRHRDFEERERREKEWVDRYLKERTKLGAHFFRDCDMESGHLKSLPLHTFAIVKGRQ